MDRILHHPQSCFGQFCVEGTIQHDPPGPQLFGIRTSDLEGVAWQAQMLSDLAAVGCQVSRDAQLAGFATRQEARFAGGENDPRLIVVDRFRLPQVLQVRGKNQLRAILGFHPQNLVLPVQHPQSNLDRKGPPTAGDLPVTALNRLVDRMVRVMIGTGIPEFGIGSHPDLLAGGGHQDRVTLDRSWQVGHGLHAIQLGADQEASQLQRVLEFRAPSKLGLARLEFEDQDGAPRVGGGRVGRFPLRQGSTNLLHHPPIDIARNRQRYLHQQALRCHLRGHLLAGSLPFRRPVCPTGTAGQNQKPGQRNHHRSTRPPKINPD